MPEAPHDAQQKVPKYCKHYGKKITIHFQPQRFIYIKYFANKRSKTAAQKQTFQNKKNDWINYHVILFTQQLLDSWNSRLRLSKQI